MHRVARPSVVVLLIAAFLQSLTVPASARTIVSDTFLGRTMGPTWREVDASWRVRNGALRVNVKSVDPRTNIGYAIVKLGGPHRSGLRVSSQVRLSPGKANVGVVAPFKDVGNHLFCKTELTPAHPRGMAAIGRRLHGHTPALLRVRTGLHLVAGAVYRLTVERHRRVVTCAIRRMGDVVTKLRYRMTTRDVGAFGRGSKAGVRIRVVAHDTRRDEDDGRSKFLDFRALTI